MKSNEIATLLEADESELYRHIGASVLARSLGVAPTTDRNKEQEGRSWFSEYRARLQEKICHSHIVTAYLGSNYSQDRILIAAGIADVISGLLTGIAAISVAVLIMREGLRTFCHMPNNDRTLD